MGLQYYKTGEIRAKLEKSLILSPEERLFIKAHDLILKNLKEQSLFDDWNLTNEEAALRAQTEARYQTLENLLFRLAPKILKNMYF